MRRSIFAAVFLLGCAAASVARAAPADLDPNFAQGGKVILPVAGPQAWVAAALQADGKLVIAGDSGGGAQGNIAVARLQSNGILDETFGGHTGVIYVGLGGVTGAADVAIQADGKIVVVGYTTRNPVDGLADFLIVRINPDGSLDGDFGPREFGAGGFVRTSFQTADYATAVAIDPQGRIVVVGYTEGGVRGTLDFIVARYLANGDLDPTFGAAGWVMADFNVGEDVPTAVAFQANGKIIVGGTSNADFALIRYYTTGRPDINLVADGDAEPAFGNQGRVTTDIGGAVKDSLSDLAIQPDGKIVAAGSVGGSMALARYGIDGALDPAFTGPAAPKPGTVVTKGAVFSNNEIYIGKSLALAADGKIYVCGSVKFNLAADPEGRRKDFLLVRYSAGGLLDTDGDADPAAEFGGARGFAYADFGGDEECDAILVQPDGRVVAAGWTTKSSRGTSDFATARFMGASDRDGDLIVDGQDNCPDAANRNQADLDGDRLGDACDPDDDGDGVADAADNCPLTPNADQKDGDRDGLCDALDPDDDNDGRPDVDDNCPVLANAGQVDADRDGIGDDCDANVDNDKDGVDNGADNCPDLGNADQKDGDGDRQGDLCDADDDNDGVVDGADNAPLAPNADQKDSDGDGVGDVVDPDAPGGGGAPPSGGAGEVVPPPPGGGGNGGAGLPPPAGGPSEPPPGGGCDGGGGCSLIVERK